ncbi:hypothetical protein [Streptomyces sp. NPDC060198]|uniref:hypothetical protein n=1 Tax=Streptomyces sp. NPDC060198 TaxID=3347070 RepID=UPI00365B6CAB
MSDMAAQLAQFQVLTTLATAHPTLPGAYITVPSHIPNRLIVQLNSAPDFETWRETLAVATDAVALSSDRRGFDLEATVVIANITVEFWARLDGGAES